MTTARPNNLENIATGEEFDLLQLGLHGSLFLIGKVAPGHPVGAQVQADQLHDALAAHDIAPEIADDIDDLLREILQFAGLLQVSGSPGLADGHLLTAVVVGGSADTALGTALGKGRQIGLILAVEHVKLAVLVQPALVILVQALEGVLDAGEIGDASVLRKSSMGRKQPLKAGMW